MRRDVRLLGRVLGDVLRQAGGQDLLDDVERLRRAVIAARRGESSGESGDAAAAGIADLVAGWPLERAEAVAHAFTVYFHLANLAEEHQRIRTLRKRDTGDRPQRESLAAAVDGLRDLAPGRAGGMLAGLRVHPVLTAHPTEARRRAVTEALRRIGALLASLNDGRLGASEHAEALRRLREEIDLLWRTAALRVQAMQPLDEVRTVMAAFDETLFRVVPALYRALDRALQGPLSGEAAAVAPAFLRFGSWVGADRDGNPFVTAQVTRETAVIQADHALRALENAATRVGRALTVHAEPGRAGPEITRALGAAGRAHPDLLAEITARSPGEPYRTYLLYAARRLHATRLTGTGPDETRPDATGPDGDGRAGTGPGGLAYGGPAEFISDLRLVQRALAGAGATRQAFGELQHLIWQAETFGFHLAGLEIRQHSEVHARALREIRAGAAQSPQTAEVLATFRAAAWIQGRFGPEACRRYVVSFTRSAADIAAVYELASLAMMNGPGPVLDVVPLFESGADLQNAPRVLDDMLQLEPVAARLAATGRHLEVMLGYSDSAKELGPVSATLRLFDVQRRLVRWAAERDIRLTLFHGRGGALGRGGGPAGRAVLAQAPGSVAGRFKVTEQGEVIFARYGHPVIAQRHLEQVASAVLLATAAPGPGPEPTGPAIANPAAVVTATTAAADLAADAPGQFRPVADRIEAGALRAYRALVETEGFAGWFARISPLEEISGMRIGSRPSRRAAAGDGASGLDDLRAIPWVFAWAQTRVNLPGWFGLGSGLAAAAGEDGLREARDAYLAWPLLAVLLDNAEMSLAKTDRRIAARYLALGGRPDLTAAVLDEYDLTRRLVLAVTGHDRLLADRPVLSRAVALRDPYVDALSHLQLRALAGLRGGQADRDRLERLLLLTVNGVAAGLQNTG
jgi:phosphoenolpyruvate carboxylase